jgi:hypothetical protein
MKHKLFLFILITTQGAQAQTVATAQSSPSQLCHDERNSMTKVTADALPSECKASLDDAINCCNGNSSNCAITVTTSFSVSDNMPMQDMRNGQNTGMSNQNLGIAENQKRCKQVLNSACERPADPTQVELKQNVLNAYDGVNYCLNNAVASSNLLQHLNQTSSSTTLSSAGSNSTTSSSVAPSDVVTSQGIQNSLKSGADNANTSLVGDQQTADLMGKVRGAVTGLMFGITTMYGNPTIPAPLTPKLVEQQQTVSGTP